MRLRRNADKLAVLRGTLDVLILRSVSDRRLHGFEISLWLDERSDGQLMLEDSALYQALHRLEAKRLLKGEWGLSGNNRRARYYRITPTGRAFLDAERTRMVSYARTITAILTEPEPQK